VSILDLATEVTEAVNEITRVLGDLKPESSTRIPPAMVAVVLRRLINRLSDQTAMTGIHSEVAFVVHEVAKPLVERLRTALGEVDQVVTCLVCGQPVTAVGDTLVCPVCGVRTIPQYVTLAEAALALGVPVARLRKACQRHPPVPLPRSHPARYLTDDLKALCKGAQPR